MNNRSFNDAFLRACRKQSVSRVPVWYMRQAGRYQPEYRKIRENYSLFEITHHPEVCAEVTLLPVRQLAVDAAILFADIMTPLVPMGVNVEIKSGVGPVIDKPVRTMSDIERLDRIDPEDDVPYVLETVRLLKAQLAVPLIGFAGAPFTLASYMIEGGPSKNYHLTKGFMYSKPEEWQALMDKLASMTAAYLNAQINAGAAAVQIFDSWVGALNAEDYRTYIAPVMERILRNVKAEHDVPVIYFGVGAGHLLEEWNALGFDVLGLDWRMSIRTARERGVAKAVQGNLDPSLLLAPWETIEEKAKEILDQGMEQDGFVFNLGHGVFPQVKADTLKRLTAFVHEYSERCL
ncbi:MAG TPA: uroporphyrinogen decarboxylase [Bacillales bacterium]|nr:uroporphyrinogen decarboxylase [Bacillales bacterium]